MTGIDRRGDTPMEPPFPVDVLADLHAGVLDDAVSDRLWPIVRHDPQAASVLDALDATRAELAGLTARAEPMPARFAARLDAAIAAEAQGRAQVPAQQTGERTLPRPQHQPAVAPVADLAAARQRRNRRLGWASGVLVAAAAVAVAVIAIPHGGTQVPGVAAAPPKPLTSGQLGTATLASAIGRADYGPLSDQAARSACLSANGQDPNSTPAGALQVTLDGNPGTLLVLPTGQTAQFRLLVVGPGCGPNRPDRLADTVVGGLPAVTPTR